ncbi:hypothetical protein ACOMHN_061030 [Nucella lapillus]
MMLLCLISFLLAPISPAAERLPTRSLLQQDLHQRQLTSYLLESSADVIPRGDMDDVMALGDDVTLELVQRQ